MNENLKFKGMVSVDVIRANGNVENVCLDKDNLLTTAGRDWIHAQLYNTGSTDAAKYIALTSNAVAPDVGDTVLADEITTGGFARAVGTVEHTAGTNVTTIVKEFTSSAVFSNVQKAGLFTAASVGILVHENIFPAVNIQPDDILRITWTITAA